MFRYMNNGRWHTEYLIYGFRCLQRTHKTGEFMPPRTEYITQGRDVFKNIRQQRVV